MSSHTAIYIAIFFSRGFNDTTKSKPPRLYYLSHPNFAEMGPAAKLNLRLVEESLFISPGPKVLLFISIAVQMSTLRNISSPGGALELSGEIVCASIRFIVQERIED